MVTLGHVVANAATKGSYPSDTTLRGIKKGAEALALQDKVGTSHRGLLLAFTGNMAGSQGYQVSYKDSKGKTVSYFGGLPSNEGRSGQAFFDKSKLDSSALEINFDRYKGRKAPDESGDWFISEITPATRPSSCVAIKGQTRCLTPGTSKNYIWSRKPSQPAAPPPTPEPPADDKFKGSTNLHEARERADSWLANYRLGDEQNIRDLGGDYGDRPDFTQPDVFNTLYALGQRGNTRYRYRWIPQMRDEANLQAMEIGESARHHFNNFKGKVGTITDPMVLYNKLKGDVKV